uniref:Uncharacterized protein n=1 Tax=Arundo donax TaxID=35708 RepID=A0A0A9AV52_ARUDO
MAGMKSKAGSNMHSDRQAGNYTAGVHGEVAGDGNMQAASS